MNIMKDVLEIVRDVKEHPNRTYGIFDGQYLLVNRQTNNMQTIYHIKGNVEIYGDVVENGRQILKEDARSKALLESLQAKGFTFKGFDDENAIPREKIKTIFNDSYGDVLLLAITTPTGKDIWKVIHKSMYREELTIINALAVAHSALAQSNIQQTNSLTQTIDILSKEYERQLDNLAKKIIMDLGFDIQDNMHQLGSIKQSILDVVANYQNEKGVM